MHIRSFLTFIVLLCACENPIDFQDFGTYTPTLVINNYFTPDSLWSVRISKSIAINEPSLLSELFVRNAKVLIYSASNPNTILTHTENGIYRSRSGLRPMAGENYTIEASSLGFQTIRSTSSAPKLNTQFVSIHAVDSIDFAQRQLPTYRLRFRVIDLPGKSYYRLKLYEVAPTCSDKIDGYTRLDPHGGHTQLDYHLVTSLKSSEASFFSDPISLDEPPDPLYGDFSSAFNTVYFSDRLFEDTHQEFELFFEPYISLSTNFVSTHFMVEISGLSEDYFLHERSRLLQFEYLDPSDYLFTTPIELYSNVERGLGIFAGYSIDTYRIDSKGNKWVESDIGLGEHPIPLCYR